MKNETMAKIAEASSNERRANEASPLKRRDVQTRVWLRWRRQMCELKRDEKVGKNLKITRKRNHFYHIEDERSTMNSKCLVFVQNRMTRRRDKIKPKTKHKVQQNDDESNEVNGSWCWLNRFFPSFIRWLLVRVSFSHSLCVQNDEPKGRIK